MDTASWRSAAGGLLAAGGASGHAVRGVGVCGSGSGPEVGAELEDAGPLSVGSWLGETLGSVVVVDPVGAGPEVGAVLDEGATLDVGFTLLVGEGATGAVAVGATLVVGLTGALLVGEGVPLGFTELIGVVLEAAGAGVFPSVVEQPRRIAPRSKGCRDVCMMMGRAGRSGASKFSAAR